MRPGSDLRIPGSRAASRCQGGRSARARRAWAGRADRERPGGRRPGSEPWQQRRRRQGHPV